MQVDEYGLEVLSAAQCRALLATHSVGRLGTSIGALPVVVPVDYAVDGRFVAMRIKPDTVFDKSLIGCVVGFEVDALGDSTDDSWFVNVTGEVREVEAETDIERLEKLGVPELLTESHWVRISTKVVFGRRKPRP
ncbi:MAG TPA: pyridoxamine 5'-phosphate oxidase family protein [Acidimicrobiales bacterium]|nr:pyridoxamine 5'-phosphate oxidase family protein [Acidimicrobiales bacterium]